MPISYNKKLSAITNNSALTTCAMPVIVCDENLHVCMISQGARRVIKPISLGKNMSRMFSDEERTTLQTFEGATLTNPKIGSKEISAITVCGKVEGEKYAVIIVEPRAMFGKVPAPWYVVNAFDAVASAVTELISMEKPSIKHIEWSCAMLTRLAEFTQSVQDCGLYSALQSGDVYREIDIVISESVSALRGIGVRVKYSKTMCAPFCTSVQPLHIYLALTTLLPALSLVSEDGIIEAECLFEADTSETLDIRFTINPDVKIKTPIKNFDELISYIPHLYLELAALKDLANVLDMEIRCESIEDKLTLSVCIPADATGTLKFRAADIIDCDAVRTRFAQICDYIDKNK